MSIQLILHQTHHIIGDFTGVFDYMKKAHTEKGIHIFPELFLTGYPLKDLCLQQPFFGQYLKFIENLDSWFLKLPQDPQTALLVGGLKYDFDFKNRPSQIFNVIYLFTPGKKGEILYTKRLLPNYDIFDEKKYFTSGDKNTIWNYEGKHIALLICEDMWFSDLYDIDPVDELQEDKNNIDLVINLSAGPYHLGKEEKRLARAQFISSLLEAPFVYVNRVGGEDGVLFDGGSFVINGAQTLIKGRSFRADCLRLPFPLYNEKASETNPDSEIMTAVHKKIDDEPIILEHDRDTLFKTNLDFNNTPPTIPILSDKECDHLIQGLQFGIFEYISKIKVNNLLVAFSGGLDSALVLAIAHLLKEKNVTTEALFMPGLHTSSTSHQVVDEMCHNLNIPLKIIPVKFLHKSFALQYQECTGIPLSGQGDENAQVRLRTAFLFAHANQTNSIVLNTSNKSELAIGYSTLYGDSTGAISVLGDIYKSEVFQLADYIDKIHHMIPKNILSRPPSAELKPNQKDEDTLPPYGRLDPILEGILSYQLNLSRLIESGFSKDEIDKVYNLYLKSEYKRYQFCPIIKVRAKSFDSGYRVPISKKIPKDFTYE